MTTIIIFTYYVAVIMKLFPDRFTIVCNLPKASCKRGLLQAPEEFQLCRRRVPKAAATPLCQWILPLRQQHSRTEEAGLRFLLFRSRRCGPFRRDRGVSGRSRRDEEDGHEVDERRNEKEKTLSGRRQVRVCGLVSSNFVIVAVVVVVVAVVVVVVVAVVVVNLIDL